MRKLTRIPGSLLTILALAASVHPRIQSATNENVVTRARGAYYSLARKGFKGFTASVEPNWEVILAQTATPGNLLIFRAVQFSLVVDANGAITLTHEVGPQAAKPELRPTVNLIHADVQRLVSGFFNTWRIFLVNSPFPDAEFQLENQEKQHKVFYATQSGKVSITMTDDLVITEWHIVGPTAKRTVKPQFQKTADGLLLTGYQGIFEPIGPGIKTTLDFHIEYQDAGGMKVPYKVSFTGMHGSEFVESELVFRVKS